jgi:hypothetical protein
MERPARIPTRRGDVLILVTTVPPVAGYALATVCADGQQDFGAGVNETRLAGLGDAMKLATRLLVPGHRIWLSNLDTGEWSMVSTENAQTAVRTNR